MIFKKTNILKRIIYRNKILFNFSKVINLIIYILLKPLFRVSKFIQLKYAKTSLMRGWDFNKNYKKKNLNYINENILNYQLKNYYYNFVFWSDSINYFDLQEVKYLLKNIEKCLVENGILHIKSPIMFNGKIAETNKQVKFAPQTNELLDLIKSRFEILYFKETDFIFRTDLDVIARVK